MRLKSIGISNFKAFGKESQTIPIKPITLVFGPNSAGKSSLLHSLLWLNHAESRGETDITNPLLAGKSVNLGGFDSCLNRKSGMHRLKFSITIENPAPDPDSARWIETMSQFKLEIACARTQQTKKPRLIGCDLYADDQILLRARVFKDLSIGARLEWNHPSLRIMLPCEFAEEDGRYYEYLLDCAGIIPSHIELDEVGSLFTIFAKEPLGDLFMLLAKKIPDQITEIFGCFSSVIGAMLYLPPLRAIPDRAMDLQSCELAGWHWLAKRPEICDRINDSLRSLGIDHRVKVRGLIPADTAKETIIWALAQAETTSNLGSLADAVENAKDIWASFGYQEYKQWLEHHPALFKKMVDYWYDIVSTDYHFEYYVEHAEADKEKPVPHWWIKERAEEQALSLLDDWGSVTDIVVFGNEAARLFISEDQDVRDAIMAALKERGLDKDLLPGDGHLQLRLHDPERDVWVALQDVGVGTSQSLPIIIEAHAQQNKLIAIEQPELHLHPRLQADFGDVFIECALGENQNTFLLETHSEHLILRILRRIRETTEGEMSEWPEALRQACPNGIRPEDVAVLYVQAGKDGAEVIELPVTPDGDFARPWPGGFFAERDNELF